MAKLILASQSPRRKELLAAAGFEFTVRARPVEEVRKNGENPVDYVRRLAREKAGAAWERLDEVALGADTVVVLDEHVLEKPVDFDDAVRMLRMLSGREHSVITGICLRHAAGAIVDHAETRVRFHAMADWEIEEYVRSGEPMDKAGAYAIQGLASKYVERIDGCYFNVVGLPVSLVYGYWRKL
ncbi:MAG: Maf family protein [Bryobacteraceae bacterium]